MNKPPVNHERLLGELLAVLCRDGGQYIEKHGYEKAVERAKENYYFLVEDRDRWIYRMKSLEERLHNIVTIAEGKKNG